MKKLVWNLLPGLMAIAVMLFTASCEKDNDREERTDKYEEAYKPIIKNYVEKTIYPTYENMAKAALVMREANNNLKDKLDDDNMKAAAEAWMSARIYWELSEAFLFGPISEDGYDIDGHIDSWPLETIDIDNSIEEIRKNNKKLTGEEVWSVLDAEVIGFHVTEYLLFNDGAPRKASELDDAQLSYLTAVTDALVWDCVMAYVAWKGESGVSEEIRKVFNENKEVVAFYNDRPNFKDFGDKFMNNNNSIYSSWKALLEEIADGAIEIAGEVGATKILEPYNEKEVTKVESWYSWHSLDDYQNNILSIKNAYLGGMDDNTRTNPSLSTYIASVNAELDAEVKAKIQDCIDKIKAIGTGGFSFYEVVRDQINQTQVNAAAEACGDLEELFQEIKKNLE